jgi:fructose/tagatose bisphosphate aldolase
MWLSVHNQYNPPKKPKNYRKYLEESNSEMQKRCSRKMPELINTSQVD